MYDMRSKTMFLELVFFCYAKKNTDILEFSFFSKFRQIQVIMETERWVVEVRKEFPGLQSSKNWVLCDSPGGTQVHQVTLTFQAAYLKSCKILKSVSNLLISHLQSSLRFYVLTLSNLNSPHQQFSALEFLVKH